MIFLQTSVDLTYSPGKAISLGDHVVFWRPQQMRIPPQSSTTPRHLPKFVAVVQITDVVLVFVVYIVVTDVVTDGRKIGKGQGGWEMYGRAMFNIAVRAQSGCLIQIVLSTYLSGMLG